MMGAIVVMIMPDSGCVARRGTGGRRTSSEQGENLFRALAAEGATAPAARPAPRSRRAFWSPGRSPAADFALADDNYVRDCILEPKADPPAGYDP